MEPVSVIVTTALGYILSAASQSKAAEDAKEEVLSGFWKWVKGRFIKANKEKQIQQIDQAPQSEDLQEKIKGSLYELMHDPEFTNELQQQLSELKSKGIPPTYELPAQHYKNVAQNTTVNGDFTQGDVTNNTINGDILQGGDKNIVNNFGANSPWPFKKG